MRLLEIISPGEYKLTRDLRNSIPAYAILSHTWAVDDEEEVTFEDFQDGTWKTKPGCKKIEFCGQQAASDGLRYFWIDTCCIRKSSDWELSQAINSMFRWYKEAAKCYVFLQDVSAFISTSGSGEERVPNYRWESAFRESRWFTRGWTLQELIAPPLLEFFSAEGERLCDKRSITPLISDITGIPIEVLRGQPLSHCTIEEKIQWGARRVTTMEEDAAYCLLGIFDVHMNPIYGERRANAFRRLRREVLDKIQDGHANISSSSDSQGPEVARSLQALGQLTPVPPSVQPSQLSQARELEVQQQRHELELQALREQYEQQMQRVQKQQDAQKKYHQEQLLQQKEYHQEKLDEQKDYHKNELHKQECYHQHKLDELEKRHRKDLEAKEGFHKEVIQKQKNQFDLQEKQHQQETQDLKRHLAEQQKELEMLRARYELDIQKYHFRLRDIHKTDMEEIKIEHENHVQNIIEEYQATQNKLREEIMILKAQNQQIQDELNQKNDAHRREIEAATPGNEIKEIIDPKQSQPTPAPPRPTKFKHSQFYQTWREITIPEFSSDLNGLPGV